MDNRRVSGAPIQLYNAATGDINLLIASINYKNNDLEG